MKNLLRVFISLILLLMTAELGMAENAVINGRVSRQQTGQSLAYVNIFVKDSDNGTISDEKGEFQLTVESLPVQLMVSHIGFKQKEITVTKADEYLDVTLKQDILSSRAVEVSATRAVEGKTPVAFSTLTIDEIETRYTVEDVPMVLAMEPGIYSYSESGNGTGYSYVSIRGFDQSRIAVMLDNVPLNDNESHQVYWVDHGDILADAKDVQIQRGIGNSLYGAAAFGGSINVLTQIAKPEAAVDLKAGYGSFNTQKYSAKVNSGEKLGDKLSAFARVSSITSDGYREYHDSRQQAFSAGVEHRTEKMTNQFRALVGYENTDLAWDGVYAADIDDREARRESYRAYTDDFLQQIYSLNTFYRINENFSFRNVAYLVMGSGYYEVEKSDENYYEYNLDITDKYTDEQEQSLTTDLLRRKWIVNNYFGVTPTLTFRQNLFRIDIGSELRSYTGDHYGEVKDFSQQELLVTHGNDWYKYYDYTGKKFTATSFVHATYFVTEKLSLMADMQYQLHQWELDQKVIGHAVGHSISADWDFINPRFGAMYHVNDEVSFFANYGKAHKEPADNQIIEADDVYSEPVMAAAEAVDDYELGFRYVNNLIYFKANAYRIDFENEQLKNIDVEQEGEYEYYSADATIHQGIELSANFTPIKKLGFFANASFAQNIITSGDLKDNVLPNTPSILANFGATYKLNSQISLFTNSRYVGKQYLDNQNIGEIDPYFLVDLGGNFKYKNLTLTAKVNNLFDTLYSTYGYGYEWDGYHAYYWPGATRSAFVSLSWGM
ncbi:MAG: TonB-dependent receptor [Fidelibacterota bacterium]